ncbi:MAG TPA: hypothetical protein VF832_21140 [Longimicrobiales bacterium]
MLSKPVVLSVALAVAAVTGACASGRGVVAGWDDFAQAAPARNAIVHVDNHNWQDVDVFAVREGMKVRLGMVTSMAGGDFKLPESFLVGSPNVQLRIDPIGSSMGYMTQTILVAPGQTVDLRIENNLNLTSYSVY